jgi:ubiquinone/menaquinone biosynthesis C-methylase UbiE
MSSDDIQPKVTTDAERWDAVHQKISKQDEAHSHYAEEKEKLFPRSSMVAELGGGTGSDALHFLRKGHSVVILDISKYALAVAMERAGKENLSDRLATQYTDFGMHQMPIKDESVDIVYSRISLNYFDAEHTKNLFADIYRMLKVGGTAYISLKSPEDEKEMEYLENIGVVYEPNVYIESGQLRSRFTKSQLEVMLQSAGIKDFKVNPFKEPLKGMEETGRLLILNEVIIRKK